MKYAFAGDRKISCNILKFLIDQGHYPSALFVSRGKNASHSEELIQLTDLPEYLIFRGNDFKTAESISILNSLELDYVFGIHFPYIIPTTVLNVPSIGFLNLHPAFLPFNKGWNTPSWAIHDKTPFGATLHFMSEQLDEGDIIAQEKLEILIQDTANSLYQRALKLEEKVFKDTFPSLRDRKFNRTIQKEKGTSYFKNDLMKIQKIDLEKSYKAAELIDILRALTTSESKDAAFFTKDGQDYTIQVDIQPRKKE